MACLNSGEVRVGQHPVAGRGTDGDRRPWAVPQNAARSTTGSDSGPRFRLDRGAVGTVKPPLGLGPGADWELTRGPHGLLPSRRDPGPVTLPRVGRLH
jgi:hypothetical protein